VERLNIRQAGQPGTESEWLLKSSQQNA